MKTLFQIVVLLGVAAAALLLATPPVGSPENTIEKQFTVKANERLLMSVDYGDIEIVGADTDEVSVTVQRKVLNQSERAAGSIFKRHAVAFHHTNDTVSIMATGNRDADLHPLVPPNLRVHYRLIVPRAMKLSLETGRGSIYASEIRGDVSAETRGDDLEVSFAGAPGKCEFVSHGGEVRLTVPDDASFDINFRSAGAPIVSEIPVERQPANHAGWKGIVGGGGNCLQVISAGGKITLAHRKWSS
jgi:hypothetical protein